MLHCLLWAGLPELESHPELSRVIRICQNISTEANLLCEKLDPKYWYPRPGKRAWS
jgi:hypothetical protein